MKSDHLSRVSESLGFSQIKPSLGTPVFSDACWNCNPWWCLCLSFMVSNDFMATCHKCNQPNHNNLIQVGCFPLPISEKLFLRIVSLVYLSFGDKGFFVLKLSLLREESWQLFSDFRHLIAIQYILMMDNQTVEDQTKFLFNFIWWKANARKLINTRNFLE